MSGWLSGWAERRVRRDKQRELELDIAHQRELDARAREDHERAKEDRVYAINGPHDIRKPRTHCDACSAIMYGDGCVCKRCVAKRKRKHRL